jgi:glutathione S-transferase
MFARWWQRTGADTRVRWALEEVEQPYEVRLISFKAMKESAHLTGHLSSH